jgi:bifunctional non-homologous end joining protein LigD
MLLVAAAASSEKVVRLLTRRGIDWTNRYPTIAVAVAVLACHSCLIDGEVVICGEDGVPVFDRLR